ncbi:MAG TPA: ATP synthase F0 subunit B [bacterium]|nr:ATP synthase F0 subunit B [bacterium]
MRRALRSLTALTLALLPSLLLAASEAAPEGGEHHGPGMAVVYHAINFGILFGLLFYFLRKPVKEFFASRATLIRGNIEEAKQRKEEAAKKYAEYEQRLQSIEGEMQGLISSLKHDGELEQKRLLETAQQQAASLQSNSERMLQQELRKAKEDLKREAVGLAGQLAEDLIRKNLTPEDQGRLVGHYLDKMEKLG